MSAAVWIVALLAAGQGLLVRQGCQLFPKIYITFFAGQCLACFSQIIPIRPKRGVIEATYVMSTSPGRDPRSVSPKHSSGALG